MHDVFYAYQVIHDKCTKKIDTQKNSQHNYDCKLHLAKLNLAKVRCKSYVISKIWESTNDWYVTSMLCGMYLGSGKSSLVCAICLGLAGSPKTLGRADNVSVVMVLIMC